ncbi:MAG: STM3941 family protein [Sarcina sp.]
MNKSLEVLSNKRELENRTLMSYGIGVVGAIVAFMALFTSIRIGLVFYIALIPIVLFFLFCAYGIYSAFRKIKVKEPYFIINEKGFYFKGIFDTATTIKWDNVEKFEFAYYKGEKVLAVYMKDDSFIKEECSWMGVRNYNSSKKVVKGKGFFFPESYFDESIDEAIVLIEYYTKQKVYLKSQN